MSSSPASRASRLSRVQSNTPGVIKVDASSVKVLLHHSLEPLRASVPKNDHLGPCRMLRMLPGPDVMECLRRHPGRGRDMRGEYNKHDYWMCERLVARRLRVEQVSY